MLSVYATRVVGIDELAEKTLLVVLAGLTIMDPVSE